MRRAALLVAAAAALGVPACILDLDGLTGGAPGGAGAGGDGAGGDGAGGNGGGGGGACVACALCEGTCDGADCTRIADTPDAVVAFRVAAAAGAVYTSDPQADAILRLVPGQPAVSLPVAVKPHAIAATSAHIFFSTENSGMYRCDLPDCAQLAQLSPSPDAVARQIVADETHLWWVKGPDLSSGKVLRCTINDCVLQEIQANLNRPHGIAMDAEHVFWTEHGNEGANAGVIYRAEKSGAGLTAYLSGLNGPSGIALTPTHVYFTLGLYEGKIYRCARGAVDCGPAEEVTPPAVPVATPVRSPFSIAVAGERVYWTNDGDATVMSCPTVGCATNPGGFPDLLAAAQSTPSGVIAPGGCVLWASSDGLYAAPAR